MPPRPRLVVLGSGWGAFNLLRRVDQIAYDVAAVSPRTHYIFTPLLPSSAVGTVDFRSIQEPIRRVLPRGFLYASAREIDLERRVVKCNEVIPNGGGTHLGPSTGGSFEVPYDLLVLAVGAQSNTFNTPGVNERLGKNIFFLKELHHARAIRSRITQCFERAAIHPEEREKLLSFVVVGGGPTGAEFVGELSDFVHEDAARFFPELKPHVRVTLVEAGGNILSTFDKTLVSYAMDRFITTGVAVRTKTAVKAVGPDGESLELSDGSRLPFGLCVWAAGVAPVPLVDNLPPSFERQERTRRVVVDDHLRVAAKEAQGRVFALGDVAVNLKVPLPMLAQVAHTQGAYLADALNDASREMSFPIDPVACIARSLERKPYRFFNKGAMTTLGGWRGIIDFTHVGATDRPVDLGHAAGLSAFLAWRSSYWGRQVSLANKINIPFNWMRSFLLGRDVSVF